MGKLALAGTSLIAAIPGAVLTYLLIVAILSSLEPMPTLLKVCTILLLLISLMMALFPTYVLVWYRREKVVKADKSGAAKGEAGLLPEEGEVFSDGLIGDEIPGDDLLPDDAEDELLGAEFEDEELVGDEDEAEATISDTEFEPADDWDDEGGLDTFEDETRDFAKESDSATNLLEFGDDEDEFPTTEFENSSKDLLEAEDVEDSEATFEELETVDSDADFTAAADFDDDFSFDDFEEDDDEKHNS